VSGRQETASQYRERLLREREASGHRETKREHRERLERELKLAESNLAGWRAQLRRGKGPAPLDLRVEMGDAEAEIRRLTAALDRLRGKRTVTVQEDP
jgi:transposase-like protein